MGGMTYTMTDTTKLSTAECYGIALCELGEEHKDVVALTADLAKSTKIGMFGEQFPERFFNVGIAEQNLFDSTELCDKEGEKCLHSRLDPYLPGISAFLEKNISSRCEILGMGSE